MAQVTANPSAAQTDTILVAAPAALKKIVVHSVAAYADAATTVSLASNGLAAVKEVTNVDRGTSTGGTFTLTVDGVTTASIAQAAAASAVKSALELLSTVTTVTVTGTGTVGDPWVCTFDDPIKNLAVSGTGSLTGGDTTLTVTQATAGLALGALKWRQYLAINGSAFGTTDPRHALFECANGAALTYSGSATANLFLSVNYRIENSYNDRL